VDARLLPIRTRTSFAGLTLSNVWAAIVVLLPVGVTFLFRMSTIDLAYHLRIGEAILATHALPSVDTFTFSVAGQAWVDQQWGAQVLLAFVARMGGWTAIGAFHAALVGVTFWLLWLACRARGASARLGAALTLGGFFVAFLNPGMNASMRPQTMAQPLFTATLWILADRRAHPRRLWILPGLLAVWANVHGSFPLGLVLIGFAWAEDRRDGASTERSTLRVAAIGLLATFVGPYGAGVWRYALDISTSSRIVGHIQEWAPTTIRTIDGALFFASALGIVAFLTRRGAKTDVLTLAWLGAFFLLGVSTARGQVWWGFVFPVAIAGVIVGDRHSSSAVEERAEEAGSRMMNLVIVTALIAFAAVGSPWFRDRPDPSSGSSSLLSNAPGNLVEAVRSEVPSDARVFVTAAYTSWFEYASPEYRIFVDSRIELFPEHVWTDYVAVIDAHDGWQEILDRRRVDAIVLRPEDGRIVALLADDPAWRTAFRDGTGSLFVRS
jgi:hypothetical protein